MTKARDLANGATALSAVSATELGYLDGVTSAIQTQADAKVAKATLTTTGDTFYASAASTPARLGIGSTGNVLTVAGGLPSWAAPAGGGNYSLLNAGGTSLSGTTTTVSGISGMNKLMIFVSNASTNSTSSSIYFRLNTDSTANYRITNVSMELTNTYQTDFFQPQESFSSTADTFVYLGDMNNISASDVDAQIKIDGCNSAGIKVFQFNGGGSKGGGGNANTGPTYRWGGGVYQGSSTISSVSIISGASFDAGKVYIYGSA